MKIFVNVFCYDRPRLLRVSVDSIMANAVHQDCHILFTNDGDDPSVNQILQSTVDLARSPNCVPVFLVSKSRTMGMVHSSKLALAYARMFNPQYWFIHESDYVFRKDAYEKILQVFETERGRMCLGIVGYDSPDYYKPNYRDHIYPNAMKEQVGVDNVNRSALYKFSSNFESLPTETIVELASNTCPTSYLHWHRIMEIGREFPEIHDLLDQAVDPRDNPDYSISSVYRRLQMFDDGMLSHAISLVWNRWAIKHDIDRDRFGAWLNIKPSVSQAVTGGGLHSQNCPEGSTTSLSPTWIDT